MMEEFFLFTDFEAKKKLSSEEERRIFSFLHIRDCLCRNSPSMKAVSNDCALHYVSALESFHIRTTQMVDLDGSNIHCSVCVEYRVWHRGASFCILVFDASD